MKKSSEATFTLECLVDLTHIAQRRLSLECKCPVLDILQYVRLDSMVQTGDLEDGNEVVDELSGSYFDQEVVTPIFDTYICELGVEMRDACRGTGEGTYAKGEDLYIWVLVVETALERAHGILCGGRL